MTKNILFKKEYASIRKYEAGEILLDKQEIAGAYSAAELVIIWAKKYINFPK